MIVRRHEILHQVLDNCNRFRDNYVTGVPRPDEERWRAELERVLEALIPALTRADTDGTIRAYDVWNHYARHRRDIELGRNHE